MEPISSVPSLGRSTGTDSFAETAGISTPRAFHTQAKSHPAVCPLPGKLLACQRCPMLDSGKLSLWTLRTPEVPGARPKLACLSANPLPPSAERGPSPQPQPSGAAGWQVAAGEEAAMYLMAYEDENGNRVFTIQVRRWLP